MTVEANAWNKNSSSWREFKDSATVTVNVSINHEISFDAAVTVADGSITYAKIQNVSATARILGRKTAGAGVVEECTLSDVLDFIGSAAQGDILYRGASAWARLGAGTAGQFLQTQGSAANPQYATAFNRAYAEYLTNTDLTTAIPADDTIPQSSEGTQILSVTITPRSATNRIRVRFQGYAARNNTAAQCSAALFNGASGAIAATAHKNSSAIPGALTIEHEEVAGGTSAITYTIRVGPDAGAMRMNGTSAARQFGGVAKATLIAEEIIV